MKRLFRRRTAMVIAVCLAACLGIGGAAADAGIAPETLAGGDFFFVLAEGQAVISRYNGKDAVLRIPAQIDGYPVAAIGDSAFASCAGLTSVVIPSGVTSIGDAAFAGCSALITVTIPDSVADIKENAFADCANAILLLYEDSYAARYAQERMLRSAFLADPQTMAWGDYVFTLAEGQATITQYGGEDADLTIPEQLDGYPVVSIDGDAFAGCDSLISVSIPNSVTSIHGNAFSSCGNLTSIEVDAGNPVYESAGGALFDASRQMLVAYPVGRADQLYMVPEDTRSIGEGAFSGSLKLAVVAIPDSVVSIGDDAFAGCDNLILLANENGYLAQYAQENEIRHAQIREPSVAAEPQPVDAAPAAVADEPVVSETEFSPHTNGDYVYAIVEEQAVITQYTGDAAELAIPEELGGYPVATIEGGAFAGLDTLIHVTIPRSVTLINGGAFASCVNLVSVSVHKENPVFVSMDGVLFDARQGALVAYPAGKGETAYTIPESTKSISLGAFAGCARLESVVIPESVVSIGDYAFAWCSRLADVTIPSGVDSIDATVFVGCDSLALKPPVGSYAVHSAGENPLHDAQEELPILGAAEYPFFISGEYGCILTDGQITILNYIGNEGEVVIPDEIEGHPVTVVGDKAFFSRSELRAVTIPSSVTSIGKHTFSDCDNLTLFVVGGSDAARYARENSLPHAVIEDSEKDSKKEPEREPEKESEKDPEKKLEKEPALDPEVDPDLEEAKIHTETGRNLVLRRTPDRSSKKNIITTMPNGTIVSVVSRAGPWAKVLFTNERGNRIEGYAYQKYLLSDHQSD